MAVMRVGAYRSPVGWSHRVQKTIRLQLWTWSLDHEPWMDELRRWYIRVDWS